LDALFIDLLFVYQQIVALFARWRLKSTSSSIYFTPIPTSGRRKSCRYQRL